MSYSFFRSELQLQRRQSRGDATIPVECATYDASNEEVGIRGLVRLLTLSSHEW